MMSITFLALFALMPYVALGQSSRLEWAPEDMYNPIDEPVNCGLRKNEPSYICDPNKILGEHVNSFNWILRDAAYNSTKCPCSNYYCETERGPTGYRISIAIVKKMKIQTNIDGRRNSPEDQAQLFAYRLENSKWNFGRCEEDIVIFYSHDDKMLAMYGGSTALKKLTPYYRQLLAYKVGQRFNEGHIVEAFNNLLVDLKLVLNCESESHDCNLHQIRDGAGFISVSMAVLSMSVVMTVYNSIWS
ncbi:uncharacterized protein LOC101859815 [Aplysia californica]|uniref:Uncharacterized protein LOC101859815 n=1 Tax=Aplysia californica TaxID=6500 RepID=A0ABM0K394_APLCA|nr:uncharacterized protein LOC101859815 [Aplysia californica]XP_012943140.1 uncharacterized protein LOC101859815 [Aplysia californica]